MTLAAPAPWAAIATRFDREIGQWLRPNKLDQGAVRSTDCCRVSRLPELSS